MIHNLNSINFEKIPLIGLNSNEIIKILNDFNNIESAVDWENGKISGAVYHGGKDLINLQTKAINLNLVSNQLHPDVFPGLRQMESEIVSMCLNLFNGDSNSCGTTTSGGTESLLLACLSARNYSYRYKKITEPELIACESVHAAILKACEYFKIKLRLVPLDKNFKMDINKTKKLINSNTILVIGSAPNFPHGIIDDIENLSNYCYEKNILFHTDCCLGSFIIAYMSKSGFQNDIPLFDFKLKGVTSISCDTHKYGFAPKGSSVIMYKNELLRECQYFISSNWMGGLYGSPTLAGSRPGSLSAGCWATMINIGENGYIDSCKSIINTSRYFKKIIKNEINDLIIIGDPMLSVISFTSITINIHLLGDLLNKKGWHLSSLQKPNALHIAITRLTTFVIDDLINDLKITIDEIKKMNNGNKIESDTATIYGVAGSIKTGGIVDKFIGSFIDTMYRPTKKYDID